ncbi:hypothetical protein ACTMQT_19690 [Pseudomonas syringae pv. aptata]|uniref:hypothetical protein n=1 Tax=Pseudomonas syringae TaxID=317 RepID=UPI001BDCE4FC|nr:hypothetical protein [Pseudomonas syringae]MCK0547873.1 hypothetical protein [Pseudomonas syringae pv. aptata]
MTQAKERPILFSAPMVRAILSGQKTVTRRVTKVQPRSDADIGSYGKGQPFIRNPDVTKPNPECPYGRPGDRLWVRETWYCDHFEVMRGPYLKPDDLDIGEALNDGTLVYAADGLAPYEQEQPTWKPSIHMPRWASRILLEITAVRVERLQEISRSDIRAEGLECPPELASDDVSPNYRDWYPAAWRELWESINGADSWNSNPWVWVVEFKRVTT